MMVMRYDADRKYSDSVVNCELMIALRVVGAPIVSGGNRGTSLRVCPFLTKYICPELQHQSGD